MKKMKFELLHILLLPLLYAKPAPRSMASPSPFPWDLQIESSRNKFNFYKEKMEDLLKKPYFAKVNNQTKVHVGETAFLPCRIKDSGEQYTVRQNLDVLHLKIYLSGFLDETFRHDRPYCGFLDVQLG